MCLYMCVSVWRGVLLYGGKDGQGSLNPYFTKLGPLQRIYSYTQENARNPFLSNVLILYPQKI